MSPSFLTDAQLRAELRRCQSCETKPCRSGCPASCSPADFILAARCGEPSDYRRAAAHILAHNPLGGVCGSVCPDSLCMARCARRRFDGAVNVPAMQAAILRKARALGVLPRFEPLPATGQRVAVVGAGPAGLGAASVLARCGHEVHVFDRARRPGGMARLIPRERLDPEVLASDIAWLLGQGNVRLVLGRPVALPRNLLARGFAAVIVAAGLTEPVELDVPGHERASSWAELLGKSPPALRGRRVAIVGDGAVALDCAEAALAQGAAHVELFARKALSELDLTARERERLFASGVHVSCRVRVTAIRGRGERVTGLALRQVELPAGEAFHPSRLVDLGHGEHERRDLDAVILAIGARPGVRLERHPRIVYAGDLESGPTSVVEAVASGKRAALAVHTMLAGDDLAACPDRTSCPDGSACPRRATCPEWNRQPAADRSAGSARPRAGLPVPLATDFFGREVSSPFLLSAGPVTEGHARVKRAYEAGWAGAVLSVSVEGEASAVPHDALDRACSALERLRREFPDRLTLASAGGALTGCDEAEARAWQATTRRLEAAGAMALEYALVAAQHGDGALRDPELPARVADWVLGIGDPSVPKLFKVPASAGSLPVLEGIAAVLARHPEALAGVTLTDSPPALPGGPGAARSWDDRGRTSELDPLSRAITSAARQGLFASGDVAVADYLGAARVLALGARTVQLCTIVTRYGLGIVNELHGGLSYFLAERGMRSVAELVGSAAARSTTLVGELPAGKTVCGVDPAACTGCGNCTRCPQHAIALDARGIPCVDASRCIGCALCVEQCFAGALAMRTAA
jgi:NADPH-dependent glutamate synthase beta subunit-like oxidoreductase/Pyruvate/2-oxoacid:ferredoxin oxidoreductase delta subunit